LYERVLKFFVGCLKDIAVSGRTNNEASEADWSSVLCNTEIQM